MSDVQENPQDETRAGQDAAPAVDATDDPLGVELVRAVAEAVDAGDKERLGEAIEPLHAADLADLIGLLPSDGRRAMAELIKDDLDPEVLTELEGGALEEFLEVLEPEGVADAVTGLDVDDAVEILEDMNEAELREVLKQVPPVERVAIEESLTFPEDSAGRLMQRDLVAVPPYWTVGQTIDFLRDQDELPNDFWEIFVVDPQYHPVGTMPLSWIMRSRREVKIADIMVEEQTLVPATMDQEEVAQRFRQYNLVSAAVVDEGGRLVGMITIDDIVDVIDEEAAEDILALAGVREGDINVSVLEISRTRFGWLFLNLGTAILASLVIGLFGASIEQLVALAILMPIVASMGGNAATQTMTVSVRALATHELTPANAWRIVRKEVMVSLLMGVLLAGLMGVIAAAWFEDPALGAVIGVAMVLNQFAAGLCGILVPLGLDRVGIDPAVASSVFVTTITDIVGFFGFLGLGAWLLL